MPATALLGHKIEHAAGPVVLLVVVHSMPVGYLEARGHQVAAGEGLTFERQGSIVYTVELMQQKCSSFHQ